MNLDDIFISDSISAVAIFANGIRQRVTGTVIDITDSIVIIETNDGDLLGINPEDVLEIIDRDTDLREDNFRNDVEADADALRNVYGDDETPIGQELDGGSDLGNEDY